MRYEIATNDAGHSSVTPLDGPDAGNAWRISFESADSARDSILTVSRIGKQLTGTRCAHCGHTLQKESSA